MKLNKSLPVAIAFAVFDFGVRPTKLASAVEEQKAKNGSLLEIGDGFPYATYEEWLDQGRRQMTYDEAFVRSQFPPEKFKQFRDKLRIPAGVQRMARPAQTPV